MLERTGDLENSEFKKKTSCNIDTTRLGEQQDKEVKPQDRKNMRNILGATKKQ